VLIQVVPNQHAENMQLLPVKVRESLLAKIYQGMSRMRPPTNNVSAFVRAAIVEKLTRLGIEVPDDLALALDRAGKGGRPPKSVSSALDRIVAAESASLNDAAARPPAPPTAAPGPQSTPHLYPRSRAASPPPKDTPRTVRKKIH
jgi:hypothetical protein